VAYKLSERTTEEKLASLISNLSIKGTEKLFSNKLVVSKFSDCCSAFQKYFTHWQEGQKTIDKILLHALMSSKPRIKWQAVHGKVHGSWRKQLLPRVSAFFRSQI